MIYPFKHDEKNSINHYNIVYHYLRYLRIPKQYSENNILLNDKDNAFRSWKKRVLKSYRLKGEDLQIYISGNQRGLT